MMNTVYHAKPLIYIGLYTFTFIKAVLTHDESLISIGATLWEKLVCHDWDMIGDELLPKRSPDDKSKVCHDKRQFVMSNTDPELCSTLCHKATY